MTLLFTFIFLLILFTTVAYMLFRDFIFKPSVKIYNYAAKTYKVKTHPEEIKRQRLFDEWEKNLEEDLKKWKAENRPEASSPEYYRNNNPYSPEYYYSNHPEIENPYLAN